MTSFKMFVSVFDRLVLKPHLMSMGLLSVQVKSIL